jgi:hypothetical protein
MYVYMQLIMHNTDIEISYSINLLRLSTNYCTLYSLYSIRNNGILIISYDIE